MKISLLSLVLFISTSLMAQFNPVYNWFQIQSNTNLNLNYGNGSYICGENGLILKSSNSGLSWVQLNTGSNTNLKSVQQYLSSAVIAVGNSGVILRSTNEGIAWNSIQSGTANNLNSLARAGASIYIAAGNGGVLLRSSNSGLNWAITNSGLSSDLNYIAGSGILLAVGNTGSIIRSTNLGLNWSQVPSGVSQNLSAVDISSGIAVAVGNNGLIIRSTDAGLTWLSVSSGVTTNLNHVQISSGNIFVSGNGVVLKSTDSGQSWSVISDSRLPALNWKSVYSYNQHEIYVAGPAGNIYRKILDSLYANQFSINANNIKTRIFNNGIFNQNRNEILNNPGFEWPVGSGKTAVFSSGLTMAAYVNGNIRIAAASYTGELIPGYCVNGNYQTDSRFKLYKVDRDAPNDSDWNNWGRMTPFGAPFSDLNNNGIYEPSIDIPGIRGAKQTIFVSMTDANPLSHSANEGFSGGTLPLGAEYHLTVWAYDSDPYKDMMFLKWVIINKSTNIWDSTRFAVIMDQDLGYPDDDYIGCDTTRNMGYCYNGDNDDNLNMAPWAYGLNPPAVGFSFLNCSGASSVLSSFSHWNTTSFPSPLCEQAPSNPLEAYNYMKGLKKDGTPWVNITNNQITKYCFSGDPESESGWTEFSGKINNCGGSLTGEQIIPVPPGEKRTILNYKPEVIRFNPGDSQVILGTQLIARGSNHKNSVTKLKLLSDIAKNLCQNGFVIGITPVYGETPQKFNLHQNYPNPFNPVTKIKFELPQNNNVLLTIYDALGKEIKVLINEKLNAGVYSIDWDGSDYSTGIYFYQIKAGNYSETRKMILIK